MRLLMVEDDRELCVAVKRCLEHAGYAVDACHDGRDALSLALEGKYDMLLVDRMLPGLSGTSLIKKLRDGGLDSPILIMTALSAVSDRVDGLDAGADDYLVKPFATDEMLARIRALLRRTPKWEKAEKLNWADMALDASDKSLLGPSGECSLSVKECACLETLMLARGATVSRQTLFNRVWGGLAEVEEGNIDSYAHFLRRRLKSVGSRAQIKTVYGVGYRLEDADV